MVYWSIYDFIIKHKIIHNMNKIWNVMMYRCCNNMCLCCIKNMLRPIFWKLRISSICCTVSTIDWNKCNDYMDIFHLVLFHYHHIIPYNVIKHHKKEMIEFVWIGMHCKRCRFGSGIDWWYCELLNRRIERDMMIKILYVYQVYTFFLF